MNDKLETLCIMVFVFGIPFSIFFYYIYEMIKFDIDWDRNHRTHGGEKIKWKDYWRGKQK